MSHLESSAPALHELPLIEVGQARQRGVVEPPGHVHGLMIAVQDVQLAPGPLSLPLQPLEKIQDPHLIIATIQLVPDLACKAQQSQESDLMETLYADGDRWEKIATWTAVVVPPIHLSFESVSPPSLNARRAFFRSPCRSPMATKRGTAGRNVGCLVTCSQFKGGHTFWQSDICCNSSTHDAPVWRLIGKARGHDCAVLPCSSHLLSISRGNDWPACQNSVNKAVHKVCPDLHNKRPSI